MSYPKDKSLKKTPGLPKLPDDLIPAWVAPASRKYLQARGLTKEESELYDLGFSQTGYWKDRLIIPIYDQNGQLVTMQGRSIDPNYIGKDKYRTEGARALYAPWIAPLDDRLIVVEGPFDLYAVQRVATTVAMLGYQPSQRQKLELLDLCRQHTIERVWIWFDRDPPDAIGEAHALALQLRPYIQEVKVLEHQGAKDPGDLTEDEVSRILDAEEETGRYGNEPQRQ